MPNVGTLLDILKVKDDQGRWIIIPALMGPRGSDGNDGITPTVSVTNISGGHNVSFYYGSGDSRNRNFNIMDGTDGTNGVDGTDGETPLVDVTSISGGHLISFSYGPGDSRNKTFYVMDGTNGTNGTNGTDGITPTVTITPITGGNNVAFYYGSGDSRNKNFNVLNGTNGTNGTDGDDGITPTVTVTTISGGHNVAFSYGAGDPRNTNFDVLDGLPGEVPAAAIAGTQASTTASKALAVGEHFWLNGTLYTATSPIASGGTIVTTGSGKNCDLAVIGDELASQSEKIESIRSTVAFDNPFAIPTVIGGNGVINFRTGETATATGYKYTDYVDLRNYGAITYTRTKAKNANPSNGTAFYDKNKQYIGGIQAFNSQSAEGYASFTVVLPLGVAYARFTTNSNYGQFSLSGTTKILKTIPSNYIEYTNTGKYIALNGTTADVNTLSSLPDYQCEVVPCSAGDVFVITAQGQNATRAWGFVDSSGNVLSVADANAKYTNEPIVAPKNSAYLISNNWFMECVGSIYKRMTVNPYLNGKNGIILGDSISYGLYSYFDGTSRKNSDGLTPDHAGTLISDYFGLLCGMAVDNVAKRGTGFVADTRNLGNALEVATDTDFSSYDFVGLCFGINDYIQGETIGSIQDNEEGTVVGNLIRVLQKIYTDNPLAKVVIFSPYNAWGQVATNQGVNILYGDETTNYALGCENSASYTLQDLVDAIEEVSNYYGITHEKLNKSNVINRINIKDILIDGLHPSKESLPMLAAEMFAQKDFG